MNSIRSCFSFSIIILLIIIISFSSKNAASGQQLLVKSCFNSYNPQVDRGYAANLNSLLSSLSSNANSARNNAKNNNYGFYNSTAAGVGGIDNVVYGLYLCRGDVNKDDCATCVQTASKEILTECPNNKTAIVWYDNCLLRYSNQTDFPIDVEWFMWNQQNSTDPERFNEYVRNKMNGLATQASSDVSGEKFAVQEGNFSAFQRLFSLAQCIPDLSSTDCDTCLREAINQLPNCCNGRLGGRILAPNCNIRYETNRFYNVAPLQPPSPAPAPAPVLSFPVTPASNVTLPAPPNSNSPDKRSVHLFRYVIFMYLIIYVGMP